MDPKRKTRGCDKSAQNRMSLTRMIKRQTCLFFHKLLLYCNFYSLQLEVHILCGCCIPHPSNSQATYYCYSSILKWGRLKNTCIQECNALRTCINFITRKPIDFYEGRFLGRCKKDYSHSYTCDPITVLRAMQHSSNCDCGIHTADILLTFFTKMFF